MQCSAPIKMNIIIAIIVIIGCLHLTAKCINIPQKKPYMSICSIDFENLVAAAALKSGIIAGLAKT